MIYNLAESYDVFSFAFCSGEKELIGTNFAKSRDLLTN